MMHDWKKRVLAMLMALACLSVVQAKPEQLGGDFALTDHFGKPFELSQLRGKLVLLFFGYTYCPDICPTELSNLAAVLDGLGDSAARVQGVFVSLDPERDTPQVLHDYTRYFNPDLLGLTGTPGEVAQVAQQYRVRYQRHEKPDGRYSLDHSADLYVIDPEGKLTAVVPYGLPPEHVLALVRDLLKRGGRGEMLATQRGVKTGFARDRDGLTKMNIHSMLSRIRSLGRLAALTLLFGMGVSAAEEGLTPEPWPSPAPPFHLQDLQERYHHLQDYRGRVVIVNFWASWCRPCRQELPSMNRAWAALEPSGVAMLAINLGEEAEAVNAFLADYPIAFPVLLDRRGNFAQRWRVQGLPTTFVLNARGEIVYQAVGEREWDDETLLRQVQALLPPTATETAWDAERRDMK
ncbi:MAG: SCO family protein [Candidatus Thiodiazotropha sp.]